MTRDNEKIRDILKEIAEKTIDIIEVLKESNNIMLGEDIDKVVEMIIMDRLTDIAVSCKDINVAISMEREEAISQCEEMGMTPGEVYKLFRESYEIKLEEVAK